MDFVGLSAGEIKIAIENLVHVVDIAIERLEILGVIGNGKLQSKAGEDGAQVMADRREHGSPLLDLAFDTFAHLQEGDAGAAHFIGTSRHIGHGRLLALAETLGCARQCQDGPDLSAEKQDRDGEQDERGPDHPDQEDMGVGGVGAIAPGHQRQDPLAVHQDANFHIAAVDAGVEPEGAGDLLGQLFGQRRIKDRKSWRRSRGGQQLAGCDGGDGETEMIARDAQDVGLIVGAGVAFQKIDD